MTMEPLDIVKQTGNTIIFEEFNRDKMDLVTLLTKEEKEIPLEKFKDALLGKKSELVVKNFAEFMEKFSPKIYETVVMSDDGTPRFVYELEKPGYECTEIKLKDHAFYKMIMSTIDRKAASDKGNMEFPYDDLKKALTPQAEMEEFKRIRKNLETNAKEYFSLLQDGVPNSEVDRLAENIVACRSLIVEKYKDKSALGLLPLLIADTKRQIDKLKTGEDESESSDQVALPYSYSFDESGELILIEQSVSDDNQRDDNVSSENTQLVTVIKADYDEYAPVAIRQNDYVRNLVLNTFVPGGNERPMTKSRDELEAQRKQYLDVYGASVESFAKAVSMVVEKFAGVKSFFDHAVYDGSLAKNVSVVIANCKVDTILNNERAKTRFKKYFGALGNEKDINRIWFGIIPAIAYRDYAANTTTKGKPDPFAPMNMNGKKTTKRNDGLISLEAAKEMLKLLEDVRIMTFVNYKASEETGFVELNAERVRKYREDFESINGDYAVFCYPNFTILPKDCTTVMIDVDKYVVVPGIYLDASYVAAGMIVGIQNYKLLKSKGYCVKPTYPCVRFDIEDEENSKRITTKQNRETTTEMIKETKDEIMIDRFGFVFADNRLMYNGHIINNTYVLNARTLKKGEKYYKNIYKTLVRNLVDQILRASSDYVTDKSAGRFISDYADAWKRDNKDEDRMYANRILYENESIDLNSSAHKLVVTFNKDSEVWDDIVINDTEKEE